MTCVIQADAEGEACNYRDKAIACPPRVLGALLIWKPFRAVLTVAAGGFVFVQWHYTWPGQTPPSPALTPGGFDSAQPRGLCRLQWQDALRRCASYYWGSNIVARWFIWIRINIGWSTLKCLTETNALLIRLLKVRWGDIPNDISYNWVLFHLIKLNK